MKLQTLNEKINVFKDQFYSIEPRRGINYDHILKDKKINFKKFKQICESKLDKEQS